MALQASEAATPFCNVLFASTERKRLDAWVRRFTRAVETEVEIPESQDLDEVKEILELKLASTCTSEWEEQNLKAILKNDGSKEELTKLIQKLTQRMKDKANSGTGAGNKSRFSTFSLSPSLSARGGALLFFVWLSWEQLWSSFSHCLP